MSLHRLNYASHPARPWPVEHVFMTVVGVMIISGLIAGGIAMLVRVRCHIDCARETAVQSDLYNITMAIDALEIDLDRELMEREGLAVLIAAPPGAPYSWHGPYLKRDTLPSDPWGQFYIYHSPASGPRRLLSLGPDAKEGTADDIVLTIQRYIPCASEGVQTCPHTD